MKKQIRFGVFETNSSTTHTLTICTKEEFEKWQNGELLFDYYKDKLVEKPQDWDEDPRGELRTYDEWYEDEYLETYEEEYTSPSGDQIVAFGKYGNDY